MSGAAGGGGGSLMSCVREASLEPPAPYHAARVTTQTQQTQTHDPSRNGEGRKGRFLRGLRRMFRRRSGARSTPAHHSPDSKSRSTSELLAQDIRQRRKEGAYSSGLSVSHDSVFTGDRSGDDSSDERPTPAHALAHLSSGHRAELVAAVRRRGRGGDASDDDEDLGLPRSPPASPPTDKGDKRHHAGISASSCSDGSLLSVGSSEMDEDSSSGTHTQHLSHDNSTRSDLSEYTGEPPTGVAPLSHSAAKHKMAVRPRRTHGAPRRKKNLPIATPALPITPELNEEMIRSTTPEVTHKNKEVVTESFSSTTTTRKILVKEAHSQFSKELSRALETTPSDFKLKSSSLPPGLALSHLVGQSPAKLSLADPKDTPRSSIKRSKSSSQGKSLRDESPPSASEAQIHIREDRATSRYHSREETNEKKSKSEKKTESETVRTVKKDESFFSRLLLRRSGKKVKKEQILEETNEHKKSKPPDKVVSPQYKSVDREYSSSAAYSEYGQNQQRTHSTERTTHSSAGQRAFANQVHKRMDNKGTYMNDNVYRELHNVSKNSITDYGVSDLKIAEETDKLLNMDINLKYSYRRDEKSKRQSQDPDYKNDSFSLHGPERTKRPPAAVQRLIEPSKAFITNEIDNLSRENSHLSPKIITDEATDNPIPIPRRPSDFVFHSGSMPKNIPYFNQNLKLSASASPPRSVLHQENIKLNRSTDFSSVGYVTKEREQYVQTAFTSHEPPSSFYPKISQHEKDYSLGIRSLGEEYVDHRSSIGKSHSFRHHSDTNSISSQENQMPSLPAIVGISEPLMESWEVNYRRSVSHDTARFNDRNNDNKRLSARNYNVFNPSDENYDSLPSTDSSYLDSLKGESQLEDRKSLFINNVVIGSDIRKRDSDISQIEAKIDNIIGSPKPLITTAIKSSSLDSVKSLAEKPTHIEDRRKTISVESALSCSGKTNPAIQKDLVELPKNELEGFISITHLNKEPPVQAKATDSQKLNKSDEKLQINSKPGVPEFLKIQLNKVDSKPATNVVLTANVTPKKPEPIPVPVEAKDDGEQKDSNETPLQMYLRKTGSQQLLNRSLEFLGEEPPFTKILDTKPAVPSKNSPINGRKSQPPPQSPTTPKMFIKKKATSIDLSEVRHEKSRTNSLSTDNSNEKIYENIPMDEKSFSSFGSKTSLQSSDSNEAKTPERQDDGVVYRRKPMIVPKEQRNGSRHDDEPELMKVFARRSLKLKDSEAETLAQEIAEANNVKEELVDNVFAIKSKSLKNEFNSSIKSRDSDKENEDQISQNSTDQEDTNKRNNDKVPNIQSRASHFGVSHYSRSISVSSVSSIQGNPKRESAPPQMKNEVSKYKKEVSDSTPEKRLRNRTFPDSSNDREEMKNIGVKNDALYKTDTISKRPWLQQKKDEEQKKMPLRNLSLASDMKKENVAGKEKEVEEGSKEYREAEGVSEKENGGEADGSPQFKGIVQMRAEWERRAKQGMTK